MTSTNKRDGGEVELLPLPESDEMGCGDAGMSVECYSGTAMQAYARANVERALAESREDAATEKGRREHTQQWYAERLAKIEEVAKREGLWPEIAAIIANGSGTRQLPNGSYVYDPPTYAQQLNSAKHKAERAEARAERLAGALRGMVAAITPLHNAHMPIERELLTDEDVEAAQAAMQSALAALEQEPQQ